jgi:glycosyltransferase involved in cell wall biosynthesis
MTEVHPAHQAPSSESAHGDRAVLVMMTTTAMTLRFLRGQAQFLTESGFDVVLMSSPGQELDEARSNGSIRAVAVSMKRRPAPMSDAISLFRVMAALRRLRPTIVSASTPKAGLLGMIAATATGVPVRHYLVRGLPLTTAPRWQRPLLWMIERAACGLAQQVQCVSASLRDDVVRRRLCSPKKCAVLAHGSSNGVDAEGLFKPGSAIPRSELRAKMGFRPTTVVVGFVGRLCRDKGLVELSSAWHAIAARYPQAELLILGPVEMDGIESRRAFDLLKSAPRVTLISEFREARPYYAVMDLLAHPSHREGLPNVCLEAASMAIPVVTTDAVGCRDSVIDGVTGRIVRSGNSSMLAGAIGEYIESPTMRIAHGAAGRARMLRDFRPTDVWAAQSELFKQMMARSGTRAT